MTPFVRAAAVAIFASALCAAQAATAQTDGTRSGGFLDGLFGSSQPSRDATNRVAQASDADLVVRIDRLENYLRQLTGAIEQLQFRNQQLEQALRRMQEDNEYRFQELGAKPAPGMTRPTAQQPMRQPAAPSAAPAAPASPSGRRSDVFDPSRNPNVPGAPRALGGGTVIATPEPTEPPVGVPGGRDAGAPLDLTTLSQPAPAPVGGPPGATSSMAAPGGLPPPPPRNTSATGVLASVEPPSQTPQDQYDLAYGYLLRKDFALAESAFQTFLKRYPGDRRVAEATYWLGESLYQRQQYRDAAESFLTVTTRHEKSGKAPDSLLRLGQALAALGEKEAACAALSEVARKFPRASGGVKQGVEREQKRVRC